MHTEGASRSPGVATADAMVPVRYRVVARRVEVTGVTTLSLEPVDLPIVAPRPGQFTMLYAFGVGEVPISVSGLPDDDGHLQQTVRAVGATTTALANLDVGAQVGVRGPFGTGWGIDDITDEDVIVVAGGLGLAPLRPAVRSLLSRPERSGRIVVLVGARSPDDLLYAREIDSWGRRDAVEVAVTVDVAGPGWTGDVGFVTTLIERVALDPARTVALVCGPEVMMRATARALQARGVPAARVRLSLERNMHCAVVRCGRCQLGPKFICSDGPVLDWASVGPLLAVRSR